MDHQRRRRAVVLSKPGFLLLFGKILTCAHTHHIKLYLSGLSVLGVEQRRNRKLIQKPKFRFLDQTFGFCRFRFRRKQKDSGEESRKIIFFAFILESENKILPLIQKAEFNILLSLSEINAEKRIFLLSSWLFYPFVAKIVQSYRNRNLQKPKV